MAVSHDFLVYVLEQLARVPELTARRMFGGVGLYSGELFFGIIDDDVLYLRVDDASRAQYEERGMSPFRPYEDKPEVSMSYFEAPADVLENADALCEWAHRSVAAAASAKPKKSRPKAKRSR